MQFLSHSPDASQVSLRRPISKTDRGIVEGGATRSREHPIVGAGGVLHDGRQDERLSHLVTQERFEPPQVPTYDPL